MITNGWYFLIHSGKGEMMKKCAYIQRKRTGSEKQHRASGGAS